MKWLDLDINKVTEIEKQTEEVLRTFDALVKQHQKKGSNQLQIAKALQVLRASIGSRLVDMERFYHSHDLDPRATRFETARLKLKKTVREYDIAQGGGDTTAHAGGAPPSPSFAGGATDAGSSTTVPPFGSSAAPPPRDDLVSIKVYLTHGEFEDLKHRREALRQLLRRGEGKMAWETAYSSPRSDPNAEGMYTYHEVPFVEPNPATTIEPSSATIRMDGPSRLESASGRPPPFINAGTPYVSSNPEVLGRAGKFSSLRDAMTGGPLRVDPQRGFNPVTPRSGASDQLSRVRPIGR